MNIVYASNDNYVRHMGVSLYSLLTNNQMEKDIHVYVLSVNIGQKNRDELKRIAGIFGRELTIIELNDLKERFMPDVNTGSFDISVLSRFFIGELIPQSVERILYLDCDTVVLRSLSRLYDMDLNRRIAGAVMEPTIYPETKRRIGLTNYKPYYNSGMLLVDLKLWREHDIQSKLLDCYKKMNGETLFCDQDVINSVLRDTIKTVSPRYNFFSNYKYYRYDTLVKLSPTYDLVTRKAYDHAKRYPAIVHFAGDERPWIAGNHNPYRKGYEKFLAKTMWSDVPKEEGKELYMMAYHIMNCMTYVFPGIRKKISETFGEKMLKKRALLKKER